jgi:hypothetical protein
MIKLLNENEVTQSFDDEGNLIQNGNCMNIIMPNEII